MENKEISENPETRDKLVSLLKNNNIEFTHSTHKATITSEDSARERGVTIEKGAKAIILKLIFKQQELNKFILCVFAAHKKINFPKLKSILKHKNMKFATLEEVFALSKCINGAVPPFGSLWNLQTYSDISLDKERIYFNCGLRTESISVSYDSFLKLEKPIIEDFTV